MTVLRMPRAAVLLAAPLLVLSLSGCSDDPNSIAAQAKSGNQQGYISGDGNVETIPAADRKKPVALTGTTLDKKQWSSQDVVGKVAVLNLWASWCPPCETEAPDLKKAAEAIAAAKKPVAFMGINYRDNPDSGRSTAARWGIPFPSLDDPAGTTILALQGKVTSPPTTLVLDRTGRIAARVSGPVTASTLSGLVDDVLAEQ
ncbi:TlpA family protein disulfide reductase [Pedococcus bigeumensis]|uniref:TlpA family protein disulfide reductase n=1 Tax=Pedococcus bigeumensis TaxID=433644 RepID=A0A502CRQ6_9MICO|nr:TlpA disulfide reductase family protein [Pedococcus bigeumensis]TPG14799.1 TlpA family protein disulfide reductase [Pedococcus bigeumensis]